MKWQFRFVNLETYFLLLPYCIFILTTKILFWVEGSIPISVLLFVSCVTLKMLNSFVVIMYCNKIFGFERIFLLKLCLNSSYTDGLCINNPYNLCSEITLTCAIWFVFTIHLLKVKNEFISFKVQKVVVHLNVSAITPQFPQCFPAIRTLLAPLSNFDYIRSC